MPSPYEDPSISWHYDAEGLRSHTTPASPGRYKLGFVPQRLEGFTPSTDIPGSPDPSYEASSSVDNRRWRKLLPEHEKRRKEKEMLARLRDLPCTIDDFEQDRILGVGAFGTVRVARLVGERKKDLLIDCDPSESLPPLCIKAIGKERVLEQQQLEHLRNEVTLLKDVKHPFIIPLLGVMADAQAIYLVMECLRGGELFSLLTTHHCFSAQVAKYYAAQVVTVFEYLHSVKIAYRDLKPENLLIDKEGHLVFTDFGVSKKIVDRTYSLVGTPEYMAPEQVTTGFGHGLGVDWWSLGILIFEMMTGDAPWRDEGGLSLYEKIKYDQVPFPPEMDLFSKDIIDRLLNKDWTARYGCLAGGAAHIKGHKFFRGLSWDKVLEGKYPPPFVPKESGEVTRYFDEYRLSDAHNLEPLTVKEDANFDWLEEW